MLIAGAKAHRFFMAFAARLKSCPFKAFGFSEANKIFYFYAIALLLTTPLVRASSPIPAAPTATTGPAQESSLDQYRAHLQALSAVVDACAKARDTKNCDPDLVGADDRLPLSQAPNAEHRLVRYGWLRALLQKAQLTDVPAEAPPAKPAAKPDDDAEETVVVEPARRTPPTTSQLLLDAKVRLAQDAAAVQNGISIKASPAHEAERATMKKILAGRDFRGLEAPTARDSLLEKLGDWLNKLFENAGRIQARAAWVGRVIVWGFILAVCVALGWGLLQMERRWRIRLVPDGDDGPAAGAASARDWQLWLMDARQAAAAGLWREAVHFVYWASISRLESKRLWPADRARTPREYLALLARDDQRRSGLAQLTASFERIWYGGRQANESDYRRAEQLAIALIASKSAGEGEAR